MNPLADNERRRLQGMTRKQLVREYMQILSGKSRRYIIADSIEKSSLTDVEMETAILRSRFVHIDSH